MICSRVAGASSDSAERHARRRRAAAAAAGSSCSESSAPPWNGSMISPVAAVPADFGAAHQEMAGEVDAVDLQPGAPRHLHVDHRERDRNAGAPVEHLVEAAVARVLVPVPVADELQLFEQVALSALIAAERRGVADVAICRAIARPAAAPISSSRARYGSGSSRGYSMRAMTSAACARPVPGALVASVSAVDESFRIDAVSCRICRAAAERNHDATYPTRLAQSVAESIEAPSVRSSSSTTSSAPASSCAG